MAHRQGTRRGRGRSARRGRTSSRRQHVLGLVGSTVCFLLATVLIVVGAIAWVQERPERLRVEGNRAVTIAATPWFDAGSTLFAAPIGSEGSTQPAPVQWSCRVTTDGVETELVRRPDRDRTGTRVVDGMSVVPVVAIGPTRAATEFLCTGEAAHSTAAMWVLPTNPGMSRTPLALVVGGIALLGLGAALHPRGRGIRPFGR